MTRSPWIFAIGSIILASPALGQEGKSSPDHAILARAGQASIKRFEKDSASWTTTTTTPTGIQFVVDVVATPTMRRSILCVEVKGRREEVARVTQKDGVWYVVQGRKAGKYRPFEAPLDAPTAYMYLTRSDPQFIARAEAAGFGTFEGIKDGIATYRSPLDEPLRKQLENTIAEFDRFKQQNPDQVIKPETTKSMDSAKELLASGVSTEVDLKSGMLVRFGAPEHRTKVSDFQWLAQVDSKAFATDGRKWDDLTDDPTTGDRDDLLMIGHCGAWRPGMKSPEADGRLLDLKTGRFRRIPFQGDMTLPGCFTGDRSRVVVTGVDTMTGVMGLHEIDLKTGEDRRLGGDLLAAGFSLFPSLSPDGKTVAVLHKGATGRILEVQICLVDLASGDARTVGEPRDTGPLSWFPDGKALLIVDRKNVEMSKPPLNTICRMGLDGEVKPLLKGSSPVILGDGKTILFQDQESRTWKTCNLEGGDIMVYANGMEGHGFPAPSPDGKRLLMMHFRQGQAPEPLIFAIGQVEGKPATTALGLWKSPAWR